MTLNEVLDNLENVVERYQNVPLIEVKTLSEILRDLGCNISYLVELRKDIRSQISLWKNDLN